jgi:hypothetical protein
MTLQTKIEAQLAESIRNTISNNVWKHINSYTPYDARAVAWHSVWDAVYKTIWANAGLKTHNKLKDYDFTR